MMTSTLLHTPNQQSSPGYPVLCREGDGFTFGDGVGVPYMSMQTVKDEPLPLIKVFIPEDARNGHILLQSAANRAGAFKSKKLSPSWFYFRVETALQVSEVLKFGAAVKAKVNLEAGQYLQERMEELTEAVAA